MSRWRIVVGAGLVVALAVGIGVVWSRGDDAGGPSNSEGPSPTPTADPTPTNVPPESPALTGEDFTAIVADIVAFLDRLSESPDPDRVGDVYAQRCECYGSRRGALEELRKRGWRYQEARTDVLEVERQRGVGQANRIVLDVVLRESATVVVDADGTVVETVEADPPTRFTMVLVRPSRQEAWHVTSLIRHGPVEEEG